MMLKYIISVVIALFGCMSWSHGALNLSLNDPGDWDSTSFTPVGGGCYSPATGTIGSYGFTGVGDSVTASWDFTQGGDATVNTFALELRLSDKDSPESRLNAGTFWQGGIDDLWINTLQSDDGSFSNSTEVVSTAPSFGGTYSASITITYLGGTSYRMDHYLENSTSGTVLINTADGVAATGSSYVMNNPGFDSSDFEISFGAQTTKSVACFDTVPEPSSAVLAAVAGLGFLMRRRR